MKQKSIILIRSHFTYRIFRCLVRSPTKTAQHYSILLHGNRSSSFPFRFGKYSKIGDRVFFPFIFFSFYFFSFIFFLFFFLLFFPFFHDTGQVLPYRIRLSISTTTSKASTRAHVTPISSFLAPRLYAKCTAAKIAKYRKVFRDIRLTGEYRRSVMSYIVHIPALKSFTPRQDGILAGWLLRFTSRIG